MPNPRLPRGALTRLGFVAAIAIAAFFAAIGPRAALAREVTPYRDQGEAVRDSHTSRGVLAEASRWIGRGKFTSLPGPWCADAVSFWLRAAGRRPLPGRMAADALRYGYWLKSPEIGAIVVVRTRRGAAGHVGIIAAVESDGSIEIISGNWGGRVARATIPRWEATAFVRPS